MTSQPNGVGYKQPPLDSRFKPGTSGNPCGRPKKRATLRDELVAELDEMIRVGEGDNGTEISNARAIAKSLVHKAVQGNLRAATALLDFSKARGESEGPSDDLTSTDSALLNDYFLRETRRR